MISILEYEGVSFPLGRLNVESKCTLGKVSFCQSLDLLGTRWGRAFLLLLFCNQELFLPSCGARLFINVFLFNVSEENVGGEKTFVYIFINCFTSPFATRQYQHGTLP